MGDNASEVEAVRNRFEPFVTDRLPGTPKHGVLYVVELGPIGQGELCGDLTPQFQLRAWMGNDAWRITAPHGQTHVTVPDGGQLGTPWHGFRAITAKRLPTYYAVEWLNKSTDWLDRINAKLGLLAFERSPRTRDNTGSCPVCFQNVKLRPGKDHHPTVVLHGYRRPGTGQTEGRCFGVGYAPFEISVRGTKEYLEQVVTPEWAHARKLVERLESPDLGVLHSGRETIHKDDGGWNRQLNAALALARHQLRRATADLEAYIELATRWRERPLPKEGECIIDWFCEGRR